MIKPTVGRVVWFRPDVGRRAMMNCYRPEQSPNSELQPMRADVIFVHDDRTVNLSITDHGGQHHYIARVPLRQEGDPEPQGSYCEWMPYQKGQAAKAEALEKELRK